MPLYESVFIARQDISAPQVEAIADTFAKVIEDGGGTIGKREHWGLRALAYRIKKNRKGHYVMFNIDAEAGLVHELERQMRIHEDILRYMSIRVDSFDEGPSAILQSRSGRDDRGRREGRGRGGEGGGRAAGGEERAAERREREGETREPRTEERPQAQGDDA